MKKSLSIILYTLVLFACQSCVFVRFNPKDFVANGKVLQDGSSVTVEQTLDPFYSVDIAISANVILYPSVDSSYAVFKLPQDVLDVLEVKNEDGILTIGVKNSKSWGREIDVELHSVLPLQEVSLTGSGSFAASGVNVKNFSATLAGSGEIVINELECDQFSAAIAGSGDIVVSGRCVDAEAAVAGSGDVNLKNLEVTGTLDSDVVGSGSVITR